MSDYYDPQPRLVLDQPILLAGQIGCGAAAIARNVCGRTGLSFVEVDRFLEHRAGRSLARLATEQGREALARSTTTALLELVPKRPAGLIVLGNAWPWQDDGFFEQLLAGVHLVQIVRPAAFLLPRIENEVARAGDWIVADWPNWGRDSETPEESVAHAERFLANRLPLLQIAQTLLDAGEQHENSVAEILLASLERVLEADSI